MYVKQWKKLPKCLPNSSQSPKIRVAQYEAYHNGKAFHIAKQLVLARIRGQDLVLEKCGLEINSNILKQAIEKIDLTEMNTLRQKLTGLEGKNSQNYFQKIFKILPEKLGPQEWRKPLQVLS